MSRSPAQLAAAAVTLRALATALSADFAGLAAHSGTATWRGPAANDHRRRTEAATADAQEVAAELTRLADRLDARAVSAAASASAPAPASTSAEERSDG